MKRTGWTYARADLLVAGMVLLLAGCNSQPPRQIRGSRGGGHRPTSVPPPPPVQLTDAGLPTTIFTTVTLGGLPDSAVGTGGAIGTGGATESAA